MPFVVQKGKGFLRRMTLISWHTFFFFFWGGGGGVGIFLLMVRFFTYGWSLLLTVIQFGLFHLRLKFSLVFLAYGGKSVWSSLLTSPRPEIGFGIYLACGSL